MGKIANESSFGIREIICGAGDKAGSQEIPYGRGDRAAFKLIVYKALWNDLAVGWDKRQLSRAGPPWEGL